MLTTVLDNSIARLPQRSEAKAIQNGLRLTVLQALTSGQGDLQLDKNAFVAITSTAEPLGLLHPAEEQIPSPSACPKKKTEFVLGRMAAHDALSRLRDDGSPVLRGQHGEPQWPEGIQGSITHSFPFAAALAVRCQKPLAIGIDLESLEKARTVDISGLICTRSELEWAHAGANPRGRVAMLFSAKETVYKGFFQFCRRYIDFKEAELSWSSQHQLFRVQFVGHATKEFSGLRGCQVYCRCFNGLVFTCMIHQP